MGSFHSPAVIPTFSHTSSSHSSFFFSSLILQAGDLTALDLRMLSSRTSTSPLLWTLPRAHHSSVTSLSCWASGTSTAPTTRIMLPMQTSVGGAGGGGASVSSSPAPSVHNGGGGSAVVPLQQLVVSGAKDGSIVVVDAQTGRIVSAMDKVRPLDAIPPTRECMHASYCTATSPIITYFLFTVLRCITWPLRTPL